MKPIKGGRVFLKDGDPFNDARKSYKREVNTVGLGDWTFHDLRHCAFNNMRLAGNDRLTIKSASGHKSDSYFERYNLVTEEELKGIKWKD